MKFSRPHINFRGSDQSGGIERASGYMQVVWCYRSAGNGWKRV